MSTFLLSSSVIAGGGGVIVFIDRFILLFIFRLVLPTTGVEVVIPLIEEGGSVVGGGRERERERDGTELERGNSNRMFINVVVPCSFCWFVCKQRKKARRVTE